MLLLGTAAYAQNITVSGSVMDQGDFPIPGATVLVQGTSIGTNTDGSGAFTLDRVPSDGILVFSCVGYVEVAVPVRGRTQIPTVVLVEDNETLEGTVVVGYGSAKKVTSLVGSVQTVNSETLKNAPSSSALDALQGQVAGLSVLSYSGVAGDNAVSMSLHGVGSLGSSSTPLYVIDGIPSSARSVMAMNPNDIESVSVLKDASATSIYGSRAANGVVYVTTKTGSYNEKASVVVRGQYGISTLASMTLYENMMSGDELMDFWIRSGIHTADWVKTNYVDKGYTSNTKWYEYFMNFNTPQHQADIAIEGGGRKVSYLISASEFSQEGFTIGNYYNRYTLRTNLQSHPLNWLKTGANIGLSIDRTQQNPYWGSAANGMSNYTSGGLSYLLIPMYPAEINESHRYVGQNRIDPVYYMDNNIDVYKRYGINANLFVEIEPVRNLKFVSRAGADSYFRLNDWYSNPSYLPNNGSGLAGKSSAFDYQANITNTVEYSIDIQNNHKISLLLGHEGVKNDYTYFHAQSEGQTDDRLLRIQDGTTASRSISESMTQSAFLSFFGHADYSFMDKYIIDGTVRRDASSRFGKDTRWATFWSAGAKWNIKREDFLRHSGAVNDLNLKVSYGTQGNAAIGDYTALGLVGTTSTYHDVKAINMTSPANDLLTWEKQKLLTVALYGRMWNRFDFDVEFYDRVTSNMLMDVPLPYTAGFNQDNININKNVGSLQNMGVDLTLGFDIIRSRDAFLRASTIFNYNSQKVTELFQGRSEWTIANTGITYVVGKPVSFYYPLYAGVDPADGKMMWYLPGEDKNEPTMDPDRVTKTFDSDALLQSTGKSRYAPINGGFSLSGGWKGLSFQMDWSYVLGKTLISNDGYFYGNPANFNTMNTHKRVSDFWTPTNTDAEYPDWSSGAVMQFDSHLLEDASFLRLKNLQVAYSLPKLLLGWQNVVKDFKITFTGRNLLTFTNYSGIDPEINSNLSYGVAGQSKQILGGIEVTFGGSEDKPQTLQLPVNYANIEALEQAEARARAALAEAEKAKAALNAAEARNKSLMEENEALKNAPKPELKVCDDYFNEPFVAYFKIGKSVLSETEKQHVIEAAKNILAHGDKVKFTIAGHADSGTGTRAINEKLAAERANTVYNLMKEVGVSPDKFTVTSSVEDIFDTPEFNRCVIVEKQ